MKLLWITACALFPLVNPSQGGLCAEEGAAPTAQEPGTPAAEVAGQEASAPAAEVVTQEAASATTVDEPAPAAQPATESGLAFSGWLKSRYIFRSTDGASDHDLQNIVNFTLGDPSRDRISLHVLGDLSIDLDGDIDHTGYYPFDSARDDLGRVVPFIYNAYLDIHQLESLAMLRVGRQSLYETPELLSFDGVRLESEALGAYRVVAGGYFGFPIQQYEHDDTYGFTGLNKTTDPLAGVYAKTKLWQGARARADVQYLSGHDADDSFDTWVTRVALWQRFANAVDVHAAYTREDSEDRDVLLRGSFTDAEWDLRIQASYYEQLMTRDAVIPGDDAYYPVLKALAPYREVRLLASKGMGEHYNIDVQVTLRRLVDSDDESEFNHEFDRYALSFSVFDLPKKGASGTITFQRWEDDDTAINSEDIALRYPIGKKYQAGAGVAHYLYRYDFFSDTEREDVQEYYVEFQRRHSDQLRLKARYSLEDAESTDQYHELRCEVLWSF